MFLEFFLNVFVGFGIHTEITCKPIAGLLLEVVLFLQYLINILQKMCCYAKELRGLTKCLQGCDETPSSKTLVSDSGQCHMYDTIQNL